MVGAHVAGHRGMAGVQAGGGRRRRLQRAVPVGVIDIDRADLDAVLLRIAHDLRRRVEAHRLAVEQGGGEHIRVAALHPCRGIDEEREARGVAFGKAVFAEPFDLAEAALGEIAGIAATRHALDELVAEILDGADPAERRHGAAQLVGFGGREAGGDDRDAHRLLLEQRHAHGLAEHLLQLVGRAVIGGGRGKHHLLHALPPPQIGMHHVALDRPRPHDRDLDDEIVEGLRLEARQHRHLRPALDLEHADRIRARQHVVDRGLLRRNGGEGEGVSPSP